MSYEDAAQLLHDAYEAYYWAENYNYQNMWIQASKESQKGALKLKSFIEALKDDAENNAFDTLSDAIMAVAQKAQKYDTAHLDD